MAYTPVAQRNIKTKPNYIPVAERVEKPSIQSFFPVKQQIQELSKPVATRPMTLKEVDTSAEQQMQQDITKLSQRDMSKDVISAGKPESISPLRKIIQASPINIGFEKNVFDPLAKGVSLLFPSFNDYLRDVVEENPKLSMSEAEKRAKELAVNDGFQPLGDGGQMLSPLDTVSTGPMAVARVIPGAKRIVRKIIESKTEDTAKKLAVDLVPDINKADEFANKIIKANTEKEAQDVLISLDKQIKDRVAKVPEADAQVIDSAKESILARFEEPVPIVTGKKQPNILGLDDKVKDDYLEFLKAEKAPTVQDINRGLELLRLDGKNVDDIATELTQIGKVPEVKTDLLEEAKKFDNGADFYNYSTVSIRDDMQKMGIRGKEQFENWFNKNIKIGQKDYTMSHRPTETGATADNISQEVSDMGFPNDFYEHPEYYANLKDKSDIESWNVLKEIKGKPDREITIYRASPKNELNNGDWVTLSKSYAKQESLAEGTPVNSFKVKAKDIQFAGDSINEFGYYPKTTTNTKLQAFKAGKPSPEGGYIANPLQGKPKQLVDNQGVSSIDDTIGKRVSPIDRAIAENKIRVVSRDGRDVYQVKKGGTWVNKRDEDSALKAIAPKIKQEKKYIEVDPEIEMRLVSAMVRKETLDEDPARQLAKYVAKTGENKGGLPEVTGLTKGKFAGRGDTFITELGYKDTEEARQAYLDYAKRKADVMAELKDAKLAIKEARIEEKLKQEGKTPAEIYSPSVPKSQITPEEVKSLEEVADQLKEEIVLPPSKTGLSLKEIITRTPLSAKVNMLDYIRTPNRVLEKIGFKKEADLLRLKYDDYLKELPKNIDIITNWYKQVPKDAGERIFNYLDGVDVTLLGNEKKVADEIKDYLSKWADRLDLPKDKRITNYITHIFDDQLLAKEFDEDLAKIIDDKIAGEVYDPFLQKRLGAMGYKKDVWLALDAYTKRATRKVHMDKALEKLQAKAGSSLEYSNLEKSQFEYIKNYIDRVNMRPTDIDNLLDTTIKQMFGYKLGQRPVNSISRVMRQMTYRGFLGANIGSALRNLSQGVNTYAILGERDTALGYLKLFNKENWDELAKEGVLENNFIQDRAISATKKTLEKADKALWLLFSTAEKINRGSAYLGAKNKALRKGMTEEESIKFAKDIVSKTQFNYDAIETPVALSSDLVKTLLQFQTYTTKQTEFLLELAKDKNFAGLARYALGGLAFVYSIGQAFEMDEKELLPINNDTFSRFELAPSAKFFKEVILAGVNAPNEYGGERTTEQKLKDITASMWGLVPGGLQAKKTIEGAEAIEEGGSYDITGKKQFEVGGTPAKDIQALLFGKYANEEAKQYFDKTTGDAILDELKKEDKELKNEETKRVNDEFLAISKLSKSEQKQQLINLAKEDEKMAEAVLNKMIEEKKNLSPTEKSLLNSSVKVRAKYIANEIKDLSREEQKKRVLNYAEKGILTEDVLDELITML